MAVALCGAIQNAKKCENAIFWCFPGIPWKWPWRYVALSKMPKNAKNVKNAIFWCFPGIPWKWLWRYVAPSKIPKNAKNGENIIFWCFPGIPWKWLWRYVALCGTIQNAKKCQKREKHNFLFSRHHMKMAVALSKMQKMQKMGKHESNGNGCGDMFHYGELYQNAKSAKICDKRCFWCFSKIMKIPTHRKKQEKPCFDVFQESRENDLKAAFGVFEAPRLVGREPQTSIFFFANADLVLQLRQHEPNVASIQMAQQNLNRISYHIMVIVFLHMVWNLADCKNPHCQQPVWSITHHGQLSQVQMQSLQQCYGLWKGP